ncbi:MAG: SLBB domain-containing protein [Candidatus Marinimicrobia bacterium]|nr:SLBB domain-containing protein [Candidatus Neomarinimicrobiota bacterium]
METLKRTILFILLFSFSLGQNYGRIGAPLNEPKIEKKEPVESAVPIFALESAIDSDAYILGPGDEIGLNILTRDLLTYPLTITPTGDLFIPGAGVCHVAGITLSEAILKVQSFVRNNAFPEAQTHMALLNPRKFKLLISGAINTPGFVIVTPLTRLDEVIEEADGFQQLAMEFEVKVLRSNGESEIINFQDFLLDGDLKSNPSFLEGDHVQIPFGSIEENGIVVRGSIEGVGYDLIEEGETLGHYIKRQVVFRYDADLENVTITRLNLKGSELLIIGSERFDETVLKPGDIVNFMLERGVIVNGYVQTPGGFSYFPGYAVADYIALAGGNTYNGNPRAVTISHLDGSIEKGINAQVLRGDLIYVPRTRKDIFIGDMSILSIFTSFVTIYLAFLSATK